MNVEIRDKRLKNIIVNAENVFFEKGFSKTTVSDICKAANCSRTTLYSHFENKENVYLAVINNSFKKFLGYFINLEIEHKNGLEKMLQYAKGYLDFSRLFPKNYSMVLDFYTLLRMINDEKLHSDAAMLIAQCSMFEEVKTSAEIPSEFLVAVIKEGQKDGSINNKISANILFLHVWAYLMGSTNLFNFSSGKKSTSILGLQMKSTEETVLQFIGKILR